MKYQKKIILQKSNSEKISIIDKGFSLVELIITITVSSFFLLLIVGVTFSLYKSFNRSQAKSIVIRDMSEFVKTLSIDIYNPDIFPHMPLKDYVFEDKHIVFYANGKKVEYGYDDKFYMTKNEDTREFGFVSDFSVRYYDRDDAMIFDDGIPYYCEFEFDFTDGKKLRMQMRL